MSWLEKLLPPKILHTDPADRRSVPEGLWIKWGKRFGFAPSQFCKAQIRTGGI